MWRSAAGFAAVGLEMGLAVMLGIFGGQYLDDWLGTGPILFWVGFCLGLGAAAKAIFDAARRAKRTMDDDEPPPPQAS